MTHYGLVKSHGLALWHFMMANAILNGMRLKIDNAGRIILPKPVRDRLGLRAGSDLDLAESGEGVLLTPVRQQPSLVRRNGLLVHNGKLPKGYEWDRLIEDDREDRFKKLAG